MAKKRVLIISVKAGAGHIRAAEAVRKAFRETHPDIRVRHIDALEYTNKAFQKSFTAGYETLAKELPSIWGMIYDRFEDGSTGNKTKYIAKLFDQLNAKPLRDEVKRYKPDAILCTHYLPCEVLAPRRLNGKLDCPLFVTLTDYDIHMMWVNAGVDRYFVATEDMAFALRRAISTDSQVRVTGIPILPVFADSYPERSAMRKRLGLRPDTPTVLLSAGGFGLIPLDILAETLLSESPGVQFLAIAGRNEALQGKLEAVAKASSGNVKAFGFVDNMHELMAASDFVVAKSGGLTTSECLAMGLPMVITRPIPGQEERNADYLLENGVALRANSHAHILWKVRMLLENPERLASMRAAALKIAKPRAAYTVVEELVASL